MNLSLYLSLSTTILLCFIAHVSRAELAVVVCGGGEPNKKCPNGPKYVSKTERHGTRCCSRKRFFPRTKRQPGCRVWGGTIGTVAGPGVAKGGLEGTFCPKKLTYEEAEVHCENLGARICTERELKSRCAKGTGCHLNSEYVWSHSPAKLNLSRDECYLLPHASIHFLGGFSVNDDKLPHGCQFYFDPNAPEFNRVIFNNSNKKSKSFSNLADTPNEHCTSGSCLSSYSVMQSWATERGTLTLAECALLPDASESNAGGFLVSYNELPYGCQKLFNPQSGEDERVIFNTAHEFDEPFANTIDAFNDYCESGWCLRSFSVMQVWYITV